jgi:GDPmannose 4,6-dehydratase
MAGAQQKVALITGIGGQDGAYLTHLLLQKGYRVIGTRRLGAGHESWRLRALGLDGHADLVLVSHDIGVFEDNVRLLEQWRPGEIYNLAAHSSVAHSFSDPLLVARTAAWSPLALLEATRQVRPGARFFQASSSEMFGRCPTSPQNEDTPFHPCSPYASAKVYAHWSAVNYREIYGMFAACGILFNHESPLRTEDFVTRKISRAVARIAMGSPEMLELGNLDSARDWGYAPEFVEGMWRILQGEKPADYVLATGRTTSVRRFVERAFSVAGVNLTWRGRDRQEKGLCADSGRLLVRVNPAFYRPLDLHLTVGDPSRIQADLGWRGETGWEDLCRIMVQHDLREVGVGRESVG